MSAGGVFNFNVSEICACRKPSRLWENYFGTLELRWSTHVGQGRRAGGTSETGGKGETLGIRACASGLSREACPSRG